MKVLVTGANGYLGRGIVKSLLDKDVEVIATDFNVDAIDSRTKKIPADLFAVSDPYEYFSKPDILLHLAWKDGFVHASDAHFDYLPKHYHFIKSFAESPIKQIAVMGTMHEVGFFEGPIKEDTPCHPLNNYGIAKNALRDYTKIACESHNKIFQWLRGFYIVGTSSNGNSIFAKIVQAVNSGKHEFPFTSGLNQYDFLDYGDFCDYVASSVMQDEVNGIINICSGRPVSLKDRVERFIKENGFDIKLIYGAYPDRPYDSKAVWGDDSKISKIIVNNKQGDNHVGG